MATTASEPASPNELPNSVPSISVWMAVLRISVTFSANDRSSRS